MDEAIAWVKRCPNPMREESEIEIRPFTRSFGDLASPEIREREARMREKTGGDSQRTAWNPPLGHVSRNEGRSMESRTAASARNPRRFERKPERLPPEAARCRRKFLRHFPGGFRDETYLDWERGYKWDTHLRWEAALGRLELRRLIRSGAFQEIAGRAIRVEQQSRHSMIFSFEKMALRDAVRSVKGARAFAEGLHDWLHGSAKLETRFERWVSVVDSLPRRQTRVLTWPLVTVFGFIAQPDIHFFLKPNVTREAARAYGFDLVYRSRPNWETYASVLALASRVRADLSDLQPRDMIDIQSFLWVQGSDEYD